MAAFANADGTDFSGPQLDGILWLAGLLEGEGSFLTSPPSSPNSPRVVCAMTDRDVIERVAEAFGTGVMANDKGKYRTEYVARIRARGQPT